MARASLPERRRKAGYGATGKNPRDDGLESGTSRNMRGPALEDHGLTCRTFRNVRGRDLQNDGLEPGFDPNVEAGCPGTVVQVLGCQWVVKVGDEDIRCVARRSRRSTHEHPVVGDEVLIDPPSGGMSRIARVLPRTTTLRRADAHRGRTQQAMVANVDQLLIVGATAEPPLNPGLMDRYLVGAWREDIRPLLCITKYDLGMDAQARAAIESFSDLEIPIIFTSVVTGEGMTRLQAALRGHKTAFVGLSGVGKTSLARYLVGDQTLEVGEISLATGKGRHVTSSARMLTIPGSGAGYIIDLPGQRVFGLRGLTPGDLLAGFPEFRDIGPCVWPQCQHNAEPGCAFTATVASGNAAERRLNAFRRIRASLEENLEA